MILLINIIFNYFFFIIMKLKKNIFNYKINEK